MKTPDVIKKGLERCKDDRCICDECEFSDGNVKKWRSLMGDALAYIEQLENLTGDHQNRVTDYTAICVGNGQMHQTELGDKTGALNCMHDQQAVIHSANPPRRYIVRRLTPLE